MNPFTIKIRYLQHNSLVRSQGSLTIGNNVKINNSNLFVASGAKLIIADNVTIQNATIYVGQGSCYIDSWGIIRPADNNRVIITIDNGDVKIADHAKISCKRIWVRFGGKLNIGQYTNINSNSEIRCDEYINIGSFNQISYNVRIWDTNTHTILSPESRRKVAIERYPYFGYESDKPQTSKVIIGDDCWIGENATIFKGTSIGSRCIIGFGTFVAGKHIPSDSRAINRRELSIDSNKKI
jgi:carbonic anhydrase/acetyltransferase-like protein (isoleucine patch superfamily)